MEYVHGDAIRAARAIALAVARMQERKNG